MFNLETLVPGDFVVLDTKTTRVSAPVFYDYFSNNYDTEIFHIHEKTPPCLVVATDIAGLGGAAFILVLTPESKLGCIRATHLTSVL